MKTYAVWDDQNDTVIRGTISGSEREAHIRGIRYIDTNVVITIYHTDAEVYSAFDQMAEKRGGHLFVEEVQIKPVPQVEKKFVKVVKVQNGH
jgi:hypothetical protein